MTDSASNDGEAPPRFPERHPRTVAIGSLLVGHALLILTPFMGVNALRVAVEPELIGIYQMWYVVPLSLVFHALEWPRALKTLWWGALATFVVNVAACGALFWAWSTVRF